MSAPAEPSQPSGLRRKIDDLGRVVIPATIRRRLRIADGDELEFSVEGESVVLRRPQRRCIFCDSDLHLETFRGKTVCWSCMAAIRAMDRERTGEGATPPSPYGV